MQSKGSQWCYLLSRDDKIENNAALIWSTVFECVFLCGPKNPLFGNGFCSSYRFNFAPDSKSNSFSYENICGNSWLPIFLCFPNSRFQGFLIALDWPIVNVIQPTFANWNKKLLSVSQFSIQNFFYRRLQRAQKDQCLFLQCLANLKVSFSTYSSQTELMCSLVSSLGPGSSGN